MFKLISAMICLVALAACQATPVRQSPALPTAGSVDVAGQSAFAALLNGQRTAQGRAPVREDAALSRAAQAHAADMARGGYFSHTSRNGASFVDRATSAGYDCVASENIAEGQTSEAAVITAWMNSSGHRRNMLANSAREFGIGRAGNTWVLMFGRGC